MLKLNSILLSVLFCSFLFQPNQLQADWSPYEKCKLSVSSKIDKISSALPKEKVKAYATMTGIMLASSLSIGLIQHAEFIQSPILKSIFSILSFQVGMIGVYQVGAPIFEPLISKVRGKSYEMTREDRPSSKDQFKYLDQIYFRTNQLMELNQQMSRNVLSYYLHFLHGVAQEAKKNMLRAPELMAMIIHRFDELYPEISPDTDIVLFEIELSLMSYLSAGERKRIWEETEAKLKHLRPDKDYSHYRVWFLPKEI